METIEVRDPAKAARKAADEIKLYSMSTKEEDVPVLHNGCEYCMEYDWIAHIERPRDMSSIEFRGKPINYCPHCGRRVRR